MATKCRFVNAGFSLSYGDGSPLFTGDLRLIGFNVNLGIGDGSSTLDLDLAYDNCIGNNSFTAPGAGRAAYFRSLTTNFEFNGIINSATYSDGSGGKVLKYKLIDPRKMLDTVYVLLKDYYCPITNEAGGPIPNFINFVNYKEGGAAVCPPGADTENWPRVGSCVGGGYGTSGIFGSSSQNGISLDKVFRAMSGGQIFLYTTAGDRLFLDLTLVASRLSLYAPWSKTDSTGMTIGALLAQASEDAAFDYIVTLERGGIIVVWPIDRTSVIVGNPIAAITSQYKQSGTLLNLELGEQELYEPSNKIIIGDKVTYLTEVDCRNGRASMMLGYDMDGVPIRAKGANFSATINTSSLNAVVPGFPNMTRITEREILCAKTQEMWMIYGHTIDPNSLSGRLLSFLDLNGVLGDAGVTQAFNAILGAPPDKVDGTGGWKEKLNTIKAVNTFAAKKKNFIKYVECWKWFNTFINEYYGRKWLVPINNFCIYPANYPSVLIGDGGPYQISDVPTDSGYPSANQQAGGILGLSLDNAILFEAADGKYSGFLAVDLNKQFTRKLTKEDIIFKISMDDLSGGNFVVQGNTLYMKVNLEGEIHGNRGTPEVLVSSSIIPMAPKVDANNENDFVNKGLQAMAALFGIDKFKNRAIQENGYSNISKLNIFQLNPLAADLDFAVVPMRSNMYVYGPWVGTKAPAGSQGSIGSTEVVVDTQLNPWNYGSVAAMQTAGSALATMGIRVYNKEFTGSFKIAEPPGLSVKDFINQYAILVSNINVTYGSSGVTTDVAFKSFTPRFGQPGKAISDLMLEGAKARSQTLSYFKDMRRKSLNEMYTMYTNMLKETTKVDKENPIVGGATPYFIMIGGHRGTYETNNSGSGGSTFTPPTPKQGLTCEEICNPDNEKPSEPGDGASSIPRIVDVELEKENIAEMSYDGDKYKTRSIMSLDGLFAPVSNSGRSNKISRYFTSYDANLNLAKPRPPMPPFDTRLTINQKYLNPIVSKSILGQWDGRGTSKDGFYVQYINFGDDITKIRDNDTRQAQTDFGFFALKGPLVLQAWGYDTEGKPIPNIIDSPADAENGVFKNTGTKNKFMSNWLENQKTWPVGPIDLRFDRARGVWVSPPQERIVVAELLSNLGPYGSAQAALLNPYGGGGVFYENYGIYGPNGEDYGSKIQSVKITVCDFLGRSLCAGTKIYAYYNDNKYIVLESSAVNETTCDSDCLCTSQSEPSTSETSTSETSTSETSTSETSTEPPSEECKDACGLAACLSQLGGDGVLGIKGGCLTIYELTECSTEPPPSEGPIGPPSPSVSP